MPKRPVDSDYKDDLRMPYDHKTNPCTPNCERRKAECAKTCPDWAVYAAGRAKRYEYNKMVYDIKDALRTPLNRDNRGQL